MIETYPVRFAYPAYANIVDGQPQFIQTLDLSAQVLGDVDVIADQQILFFTMDGKSVTRKASQFQRLKSNWSFNAVCNIEIVRNFFKAAEGQYVYYRHYTGTEYVLMVTSANFSVRGGPFTRYNGEDHVTHHFDLQVDRWRLE